MQFHADPDYFARTSAETPGATPTSELSSAAPTPLAMSGSAADEATLENTPRDTPPTLRSKRTCTSPSVDSNDAKAARLASMAAAGAAAAAISRERQKARLAMTANSGFKTPSPNRPVDVDSPVKERKSLADMPPPWKKSLQKEAEEEKLLRKKKDLRRKFKEGQKFPTPPVADASRAFYESLLEENPDSKVAIKYCVEHGVKPIADHKELFKKYKRYHERGLFGSAQQKLKLAMQRMQEKKRLQELISMSERTSGSTKPSQYQPR